MTTTRPIGHVRGVRKAISVVVILALLMMLLPAAPVWAQDTIQQLQVTPDSLTLAVGATAQLQVKAIYSDNCVADVTNEASYASGNESVATVSPSGLITAVGAGETVVTATYGGKTAQATVTVTQTPPADTTPPTVTNTDPANGDTAVPVDKTIAVTFSEDVQEGPAFGSISVKDAAGNAVAVTTSITGKVLSLKPSTSLARRTEYVVTVPVGAVKDQAGNSLQQEYIFSFTTDWYSWVIGVYMCADNNLEDAAWADLKEMATAGSSSDVKVVALLDSASGGGTYYEITTDHQVYGVEDLPEPDMGDPATLTNFLNWMNANYPSEHYALIVWNHGDGFRSKGEAEARRTAVGKLRNPASQPEKLRGVAFDDTDWDFLTIPEVREAISASQLPFVDLVAFDACLMQQVEVGYELRNCAGVMVGSEEVVPWYGFPYDAVVNWLLSHPTASAPDFGRAIVNAYIAAYPGWDLQLSAVDLSKLGEVAQAANDLANLLMDNFDDHGAYINYAALMAQWYGWGDYVDLYDFTLKLDQYCREMPGLAEKTRALREALASATIYSAYSGSWVAGSHGLAVWLPWYGYCEPCFYNDLNNLYQPLQFAQDTSWDEFLKVLVTFDTPPAVVESDPVPGAYGVPVDKTVKVTFTECIQKGENWSDISIKKKADDTAIECNLAISDNELLIQPTQPLEQGVTFAVYLPAGGVADYAGNPLKKDYVFTFTTKEDQPPGDVTNLTVTPLPGAGRYQLAFTFPADEDVETVVAYAYDGSGFIEVGESRDVIPGGQGILEVTLPPTAVLGKSLFGFKVVVRDASGNESAGTVTGQVYPTLVYLPMTPGPDGWVTFSTPVALYHEKKLLGNTDPAQGDITGIIPTDGVEIAYKWDAEKQQWVQVSEQNNTLQPLEAVYLKLKKPVVARIVPESRQAEPPCRSLKAGGWSLVGFTDVRSIDSALDSLGKGWSVLVSPSVNPTVWAVTSADWSAQSRLVNTHFGYWLFVRPECADPKLAGFTSTPMKVVDYPPVDPSWS